VELVRVILYPGLSRTHRPGGAAPEAAPKHGTALKGAAVIVLAAGVGTLGAVLTGFTFHLAAPKGR
jgi:hypothetical protein